jgi:hypothetical protein
MSGRRDPGQYFEKDTIPKLIFTEKELRGLSPNFHIHVSVSESSIPTFSLPILLLEICGPILGIQYINRSQIHESGNWD